MQHRTLDDWLQHWLAQHPSEIVMGLERVRRVWSALGAPPIAPRVFTIAGTNGKGSTVAFLDAMLRSGGYRIGRYTSPHLLRYNERIAIDGADVDDALLIDAFERIEIARADIALTYFEAGTLAALLIFAESKLDAAVLEVGLGGRLDAVNIIDADVAVITSIGLDHQDILGDSLDAIAREKAGICRSGRPVVVAMPSPLPTLLTEIAKRQAIAVCAQGDYSWQLGSDQSSWEFEHAGRKSALPLPTLAAPVQLQNAAAAVMALQLSVEKLPLDEAALRAGLIQAQPGGRLQVVDRNPEVIIDVAHNPQAAAALAQWLALHPCVTRAVFSALADKDVAAIVRVLGQHISHWHVCGLSAQTPRGATAEGVRQRVLDALPSASVSAHLSPESALAAARALSQYDERILAFGSFYLVAALMPAVQSVRSE